MSQLDNALLDNSPIVLYPNNTAEDSLTKESKTLFSVSKMEKLGVSRKHSKRRKFLHSKHSLTFSEENEKQNSFKQLAKMVKQLRKQLRKFENECNVKKNSKKNEDERQKTISNLLLVNNKISTAYNIKNKDENFFYLFLELIVTRKMKFNSRYFKKICGFIQKCEEESKM